MAKIECICQQCDKKFEKTLSQINTYGGKYCSRKCAGLAKRNRVQFTCEQCGNVFEVLQNQVNRDERRGKYCSRECAALGHTIVKTDCKCKHCDKLFVVSPIVLKRNRGQYCSRECYLLDHAPIERECQYCGSVFTKRAADVKRHASIYCSHKCKGLAQRGNKSPRWSGGTIRYYGPNWIQQRKLARQRDGGICQRCHRKPNKVERQFAIHHIIKRRHFAKDDPAANALSNLITLCPQCHSPAERGLILVPMRLL